ncbi:hypothetical protein FRB95_011760 [Tulasnella sp. JGI-2019a]|nr:hypothetical protein FRB93_000226 [Tulasnella sp. JGI-2019a]KAG9039175.1 hypothetical protein FRB95_011760 [Tulasnella sp. JGI-2019a]
MSLSERIAALNKRAQPPLAQHSAPQTGAIPSSSNGSKSVKDKAARFDHLGAAPAPRGSFGLGAPVAASQKSNRELYGNRIPSASVGKDGKLAHSGSATSLRAGSPGPTHSLRAAQSNPSSPSPSHSRTSSFDSNAGSLIGGRAQAATPAEPLTEAAVESLGAAVRRTPSGGAQAFQSVPPSVFAGEKDASSSIAVEADEASVATQSVDVNISGKASPSLTSSTVSESVLKEPPPVITSPELSDGSEVARASLDTESSFATARSASSVIPPDSSQTPGIPTITSSEHLAMHPVVEPSVAPLPLSSHLLETLQVNASGEASPSRSVVVEIGSGGGSQSDDIAEALEGVDLSEKALDATVAAGGAGTGVDADVDLDVRPNLRLQAPVLPLSSAHLKSLNIQSSLVPSSGYDTPRSMAVEVGDGSVDGRSVREIFSDENPIDEEYITSEGLSDMHTPPGLQIDLPGDGPRPGTASPRLSSPVKTSGRSKGSPVTPTKRLGTPDGAARKSSLSTLSIPGTPSDVVDMTTPIANPSELPDEHLTPPAVERSREEVELNVQPFPAPSFNGTTTHPFE